MRWTAPPRLIGIAKRLTLRDGYAVLPPLARFTAKNENGEEIAIETDELGLRNAPGSLAGADLLVLGDFFVLAEHTDEPQTLVGRLRAGGRKAYNAGTIGGGAVAAERLLDVLLERSKPRTVILALSTGRVFYEDYGARPSDARTGGVSRLRSVLRDVCASSALCRAAHGLVVDGIGGRKRRPLGTVASAEFESFATPPGPEMSAAVRRTDAALAGMAKRLADRGVQLAVLAVPSRAEVARSLVAVDGCFSDSRCPELALALLRRPHSFDQPDRLVRELARNNGVACLSLLEAFRSAGAPEAFCQLDDRWSAAGQAIASRALLAPLGQTDGGAH